MDDKTRAYRKSALDAIDYMELCARRRIVPLQHDVNVMRHRFNQVDKAKLEGGR